MKPKTKSFALRIHRWCGLTACAIIAVQAFTGVCIVWRAELARIVDPYGELRQTGGADVPLSQVFASIQGVVPGSTVTRIVYPDQPDGTLFVYLLNASATQQYASVDPGNARVLRLGSIWQFPLDAAILIHFELMKGKIGQMILVLSGLAIAIMLLSGLIYWWPRRGQWSNSLAINSGLPARIRLRRYHRMLGVVLSMFILFSVTTGLCLNISQLLQQGSTSPTAEMPQELPGPALFDNALAIARAEYPQHAIRDIRLPSNRQMNVFFRAPERSSSAVHQVSIDLHEQVIRTIVPSDQDKSLWTILLPVHGGKWLPVLGRPLVLLTGLGLLLLSLTGPLMWLQSRR